MWKHGIDSVDALTEYGRFVDIALNVDDCPEQVICVVQL